MNTYQNTIDGLRQLKEVMLDGSTRLFGGMLRLPLADTVRADMRLILEDTCMALHGCTVESYTTNHRGFDLIDDALAVLEYEGSRS